MAPRQYTELFFLDEPTALAAGHRPCGSCRFEALKQFKQAWASAHNLAAAPSIKVIDDQLATERGLLAPCPSIELLPDGAMITVSGSKQAWLRSAGHWRQWSFEGYDGPSALPESGVLLITPPSILAALKAGYQPL